ncbi:MAG: tRNA 2-thiouridine(34) synthase MnmA, partial [Chlamydiota bacterium]
TNYKKISFNKWEKITVAEAFQKYANINEKELFDEKLFVQKAKELGADTIATGHYAQNLLYESQPSLYKGKDTGKDQSYFLYTLKSSILENVLFPIGHLIKDQVRKIAKENNLSTAEKKDSTGICFIGKRDFRPFLGEYLGFSPGNLETLDGKVIGEHTGAFFYTIGQRKGLHIGGKGEAWFVAGKDMKRNVVYVVQGENHPALYADDLSASDLTWVNEKEPSLPYTCLAKIRYRQPDQPCMIQKIEDGIAYVDFLTPQRAITPRQSIVFYDKDRCLGGGMIIQRGLSYMEKKKALEHFSDN